MRSYPRDWRAHSELNFLYSTMGEFEKAIEEGQEAIRFEPRVEPAYRNLATAYIDLDRLAEAKEVLAKARAQHFDGSRLHQRFLEIAYIEGDQAAVEREIQWFADKPEVIFNHGFISRVSQQGTVLDLKWIEDGVNGATLPRPQRHLAPPWRALRC